MNQSLVEQLRNWADGALFYRPASARLVMAAAERIEALEAELRNMLSSAYPHPSEHPTMTAAWARGRKLLETP